MVISRGKPKDLREEPAPLALPPISGIKSATIRLSYDNDLRDFF
jgi:hypothetical protein